MCGIAGIVNFDGATVGRPLLEAMIDRQRHRGPDGDGFFVDGRVGFGHCRLAIIDPAGGQQPMTDENGDVILSYNGEVYNYREIRDPLSGFVRFKTESDTEVVLHAYRKWGIDCLQRFHGMFAFSLYDRKKGVVYLVRDRIGIKPLYYVKTPKALVFASELLPVLAHPGVARDIDAGAIRAYLHYQYVPTPQTIYKEINKLEPGHFLEVRVESGEIRKHRYWDVTFGVDATDEKTQAETLDRLLHDTVGMYVRSDVPFGTFLSGGIDSSIVTAHMKGVLEQPVHTFTIGYEESPYSEIPHAREASEILGTVHSEEIVRAASIEPLLRKLVRHFGEPFGDSSAVPTYFVSRLAAKQVKMVLSGDGGDENFAGYNSYPILFRQLEINYGATMQRVFGVLAGLSPVPDLRREFSNRAATLSEIHSRNRIIFASDAIDRLTLDEEPFVPLPPGAPAGTPDPIAGYQYQDLKTYLLDDILTKVDRTSMANSLEVRVPLLDHAIVESALSLPLSSRIRWNGDGDTITTKYLLKQNGRRFFPDAFVDRAKMGFGIPVTEWLMGPLRDMVLDNLGDWKAEVYDWLRYDEVQGVIDLSYGTGFGNYGAAPIWCLLMLKLWFEEVHHSPVADTIAATDSDVPTETMPESA